MGALDGRVVVVTGAARGQGAAEVEALARAGATVVATDVLDEEGAALAESLAADGLEVSYAHLDVRSPGEWAALADLLRNRHGRVDALVNNAGVAARERLPHVTLETWQLTFDINVTGPMLGIQALVPLMPAGSSIVNICSVAAMAGHAAAAYTSSKWALRGLTRTASLELGGRGIRVNAVMPGLVDTPLMASASPAFTEAALAEIPLGRVGVPADIAPTIVFLVSDDSAYYNGAEIVIDGGLSAHVSHKRIADATRPVRHDESWPTDGEGDSAVS
ncbi:SDR family NAD(P)-dependent oxidoreductase [Nocardioides sp. MAHUQ-72]|uniref:SDR family NAD(P)-dependent oxidoreductase n=1 Tax=unclassified Nocardioides TaxID=2615069 RepID=UPI003615895C